MAGFVVRNWFNNKNQFGGGAMANMSGDWLRQSRGVQAGGEGSQQAQRPMAAVGIAPSAQDRLGPTPYNFLLSNGGQEVSSSTPGVRAVDRQGTRYFFNAKGDLVGVTPGATPPTGVQSPGGGTTPAPGTGQTGAPPSGTGTPNITLTPEQIAAINSDPVLQPLIDQLVSLEDAGVATLGGGDPNASKINPGADQPPAPTAAQTGLPPDTTTPATTDPAAAAAAAAGVTPGVTPANALVAPPGTPTPGPLQTPATVQTAESGVVTTAPQAGNFMPGAAPAAPTVQTTESGTVTPTPEQGNYMPPGYDQPAPGSGGISGSDPGGPALFADRSGNMVTIDQLMAQYSSGSTAMSSTPTAYDSPALDPGIVAPPMTAGDTSGLWLPPASGGAELYA